MPKKSAKPREPQPATLEIIPLDEPKTIAPKTLEPKASKTRAKAKQAATETKVGAAAKPKAPAKPRKTKVKIKSESGELVDIHVPVGEPFQHPADDPIGDVSDGEAHISEDSAPESTPAIAPEAQSQAHAEMAAYRDDTTDSAADGALVNHPEPAPEVGGPVAEAGEHQPAEEHTAPELREPRKLERLQKVLSQAGVASRRRAEELITEGRVQVNGQVVTQLGAKADAAHDHIRVDGKLLSGAERHRYFVLNKPKGFVTTVSDPEHRPTVMEFFSKMRERLYPVGRLDYQSEGLLLVTNDGELANQLTRAASGVEKTYLVKVAGQPTEAQLDILRSGVAIDREQPGSGTVHTSPARIRQVRRGDNPWFEVVLIEGRNRELRKMFSAIGHFVEKIRRVGYGPLVLDLEPGKFRELEPEELAALRLAAEGKWKPRRSKVPKIPLEDAGTSQSERSPHQRSFKPPAPGARPFRSQSSAGPARDAGRDEAFRRDKPDFKPREQSFGARPARPYAGKPSFGKPKPSYSRPSGDRPEGRSRFERDGADAHPGPRFENRGGGFRPQQRESEPRFTASPRPPRPQSDRPQTDRPNFKRPAFNRTEDAPRRFDKPAGKSFARPRSGEFAARPPARLDRPAGKSFSKPFSKPVGGEFAGKPPARFDKPADRGFSKPRSGEFAPRPPARFDKPAGRGFSKPRSERPPDRDFDSKPPRGLAIDPVSGFDKPAGKTWSKPGRPDRSEGAPPAFRGKSGPRPGGSSRPAPGGRGKPSFGSRPGFKSGPKAGFKSGSRPGAKSGSRPGFKRGGSRPGGSRPGGKRG